VLGEAVWDADAMRDDVRGYVVDALGDADGVLIIGGTSTSIYITIPGWSTGPTR
jgi:hypothetical protein